MAPASRASSQTAMSLRAPRGQATWGSSPSTTRPRPRLSALVRACRRVRVSGKRSRPRVPARKKTAPRETQMTVKRVSARVMSPSCASRLVRVLFPDGCRRTRALGAGHEGHRGEGREQGQQQGQVPNRIDPVGHAQQQEGRDPAAAEQLGRQHAVRILRAAQDADQAQGDGGEHEERRGEQELSHAPGPPPCASTITGPRPRQAPVPPVGSGRGSDRPGCRPGQRPPAGCPAPGW